MSLPIFKSSMADGGLLSLDRDKGRGDTASVTSSTTWKSSSWERPEPSSYEVKSYRPPSSDPNSPGTNRLLTVKESIGSPDRGERAIQSADTSVISERQVKWDREAALADSKQAELFHTQWNLIREQISTFSRELVGIRMELKNLKVLEGKVAEQDMRVLKNTELLSELIDEPKLRRESDERLSLEFRETYKAITEALTQESKDRLAGDEEILRALANVKAMVEKETRDRSVGGDETLIKLQALADGLQQERLDREQGDTALRAQIQQNRQDLVNEKAQREDGEAGVKRSIQVNEAQGTAQLKDLRLALEDEAKARNTGDSALEKACRDLQSLIESEGDKRGNLREDIDKLLQDMGNALEQEARLRGGDDEKLKQALQRTNDTIDANKRERDMAVAELADRIKASNDALGVETKERVINDDGLKKELIRIIEALEQDVKAESDQRKLGDDELARRFGEYLRQHEDKVTQLRDLHTTTTAEHKEALDNHGRVTRELLEGANRAIKEGDDNHGRMLLEEKQQRDNGLKALLEEMQKMMKLEQADREAGDQEIAAALRNLDNNNGTQLKAFQDGLDAEIAERKNQVGTLEQNAEALFSDLRTAIEKEIEVRSQETVTIAETAQAERQKNAEESKRAREQAAVEAKAARDRLEASITALHSALEEEKRLRSDNDDKNLNGLKAEMMERQAGDEKHAHRLQEIFRKCADMI
mmetsp:Transcript_2554/g.4445  ORF Transcript_2554/g.4445 Transcript_2554/m.4445 type:complete len:706 (-) Transcript_2554:120-2237(-)